MASRLAEVIGPDLVALDQLQGALDRGLGIRLVVLVDQLDWAAHDAAGGVDLGDGEVEAELGLAAEQFETAGEGLHDAEPDRLVGGDARHRQAGNADAGGGGRTGFQEGTTRKPVVGHDELPVYGAQKPGKL
jgi:hypothetical protein